MSRDCPKPREPDTPSHPISQDKADKGIGSRRLIDPNLLMSPKIDCMAHQLARCVWNSAQNLDDSMNISSDSHCYCNKPSRSHEDIPRKDVMMRWKRAAGSSRETYTLVAAPFRFCSSDRHVTGPSRILLAATIHVRSLSKHDTHIIHFAIHSSDGHASSITTSAA
jgi:hypothetical protein